MSGLAASPDRVVLDRLRARIELKPEFVRMTPDEAQIVVRLLTPVVEADEGRRLHAPNGAVFFTALEGALVAAHDRGLVNETALLEVLRELLGGHRLTLEALSRIFGVQPLYDLTRPEFDQVERLARRLAEHLTPRLVAGVSHAITGGQS